jgi:tetratricopeptide (TPR) repeat protein
LLTNTTKQSKHYISRAASKIAGSLFIVILLTACATSPQYLVSNSPLKPAAHLVDVPFFAQQQYQCGPAALAMLLNYAGIDVSPDELVKQVYLPARKGSLQIEIQASTRRYHLVPYVINPQLESLLLEIEAGNPVLVLQNLGLSWLPVWHYAVAIGYDLEQQFIILHSGTRQARPVSLKTFARTWQRADNWGIVITAIDQVPASAEPERFISAVTSLNGADNTLSRHHAYRAAAQHWPQQLLPQISLGNSYYTQGNLVAAEHAYRNAIIDHPQSALALNNLAQTLADQNRLDEARVIILQAAEIGGPFSSEIQQTLNEIEKKRSSQ